MRPGSDQLPDSHCLLRGRPGSQRFPGRTEGESRHHFALRASEGIRDPAQEAPQVRSGRSAWLLRRHARRGVILKPLLAGTRANTASFLRARLCLAFLTNLLIELTLSKGTEH